MVKTDADIIAIINAAPVILEESVTPASAKQSKRLVIQVPMDCGVTDEDYQRVITRPLV